MKKLMITAAFALISLPAIAETKMQWGCEWKKGENGNYLTKVDGGCKHWVALGYSTQREYLGRDVIPDDEDDEDTDGGDEDGGDEGAY